MNDIENKDCFREGKIRTRREACELYARAFGGEVERLIHSPSSGRVVLLYQGKELASISFGLDRHESLAWEELSQVALGITRYERVKSR